MSRQRTKIGEYIELHSPSGEPWFVPAPWQRELPIEEQRAEARKRQSTPAWANVGGVRVRVTRYRLAPLVELPAWQRTTSYVVLYGQQVECFTENDKTSATYWSRPGPRWSFMLHVDGREGDEMSLPFASEGDVRTACESRLRELGYCVAKVEKGGTK